MNATSRTDMLWARPLALLAALLGLCWQALAGAAAAPTTIRLCYPDEGAWPWATKEGTGLNFKIEEMIQREFNVKFQATPLPWKRCFASLKLGEIDVLASASFKPERLEAGAYPGGNPPDGKRYMHLDGYKLIRPVGSKLDWNGKQFVNLPPGQTVATQLGYSIVAQLKELGVTVDEGTTDAADALRKVLRGRAVGAALLSVEADHLLAQPEFTGKLEAAALPLVEKPYFLLFSHQFVEKNGALVEQIWNYLPKAHASAEYKQAVKEFMGKPHP